MLIENSHCNLVDSYNYFLDGLCLEKKLKLKLKTKKISLEGSFTTLEAKN
jgi:hypothetical protein